MQIAGDRIKLLHSVPRSKIESVMREGLRVGQEPGLPDRRLGPTPRSTVSCIRYTRRSDPLPLSGRGWLTAEQARDLGVGSLIQIGKMAGEPVDMLVDGAVVARGEVVVMERKLGVRVTQVI